MPYSDSTKTLFQLPHEAPDGLAAIVAAIRAATQSQDYELFQLTHPALIEEVAAARKRGVATRIMLEHTEAGTPTGIKALKLLFSLGVLPSEVHITTSEQKHQFAHKKVAIFDRSTVIEGSTNWTVPAFLERNQLLIIKDAGYAAAILAEFESHLAWTIASEAAYTTDLEKSAGVA